MKTKLEQKLKLLGISSNVTMIDLILIRENETTEIIDEIISACEKETGRKYYHPRVRLPEDKPEIKIKKKEQFTDVINAIKENGAFLSQNSFSLYLSKKYNYSETKSKRRIRAAWAANKIFKTSEIIDGKETFIYSLNEKEL